MRFDNGGGVLAFSQEAVVTIRRYRQLRPFSKEAGGAMLGRHILDCDDVVMDEVTVPQRNDRRTRFGFFRSKDHHWLALRRWEASGGTRAFLGLWHTHPEKHPVPSTTDLRDWRNACKRSRYFGDFLYFAIVGISETRVWRGDRHGQITRLPSKT